MDTTAYNTINSLGLIDLVPIHVDDLITKDIDIVREQTTHGQFCWVCQPILCLFVLDHYSEEMVTYLEADSMFFSDPELLFEELGEQSVSLVPHNFSPEFDNTDAAGKFCVQFNTFRNNKSAREVLTYWKSCCFHYNKLYPLVYPGQTSLDNWPERFDCVKIIQHPGAGVAPWNVQHVKLEMFGSAPSVNGVPIVFYHFHEYGRYRNGDHELGNYPLPQNIIDSVYKRYVKEIEIAAAMVHAIDPEFVFRREYENNKKLKEVFHQFSIQNAKRYYSVIKRKIRGTYNVYTDAYFHMNSEGC
jgi:hypothetical protein